MTLSTLIANIIDHEEEMGSSQEAEHSLPSVGRSVATSQAGGRERPILFRGPMVRAILDGRKTQTRRVVKPQPMLNDPEHGFPLPAGLRTTMEWKNWHTSPTGLVALCSYGVPGDRLWVRETHAIFNAHGQRRQDGERWGPWGGLPTQLSPDGTQIAYFREGFDRCDPGRWRSSIHMPRWASRITLRITDVRVERLASISREDAIAEGATSRQHSNGFGSLHEGWSMDWSRVGRPGFVGEPLRERDISLATPQDAFANYINELHGGPNWNFYYNGDDRYPKPIFDANPWVWVVEFERITPSSQTPAPQGDRSEAEGVLGAQAEGRSPGMNK